MNDPFLDRAGEDDPVIFFRRPTPPADDLGRAAEVGPELLRRVRTVAVSAVVVAGGLAAPDGATVQSTGPRGRAAPHYASPVSQLFIPFLLPAIFGGLLLARPRELLHFGAKITRNTLVFLVLLCALVTVMEGLLIADAFGYQPFWRP